MHIDPRKSFAPFALTAGVFALGLLGLGVASSGPICRAPAATPCDPAVTARRALEESGLWHTPGRPFRVVNHGTALTVLQWDPNLPGIQEPPLVTIDPTGCHVCEARPQN